MATGTIMNGLKAVKIPQSSFGWNGTAKSFVKSNYTPSFSTVVGYLIRFTSGTAIGGARYVESTQSLYITGWIPQTATAITSDYNFECYEIGY